jgi:hypothetical protein
LLLVNNPHMTVAPVSSPLKVRQRKQRIWAEDASGAIVIDGTTAQHPDAYVCIAAGGTWRIAGQIKDASPAYRPVFDPAGREVARIERTSRREWELRLAGGGSATVTSRSLFMRGVTCTVGDLAGAATPGFAPQRYFTLTLTEAALARPDRDAIAVASTWICESRLAALIADSAGGD